MASVYTILKYFNETPFEDNAAKYTPKQKERRLNKMSIKRHPLEKQSPVKDERPDPSASNPDAHRLAGRSPRWPIPPRPLVGLSPKPSRISACLLIPRAQRDMRMTTVSAILLLVVVSSANHQV